jgi:hypothetical protein
MLLKRFNSAGIREAFVEIMHILHPICFDNRSGSGNAPFSPNRFVVNMPMYRTETVLTVLKIIKLIKMSKNGQIL